MVQDGTMLLLATNLGNTSYWFGTALLGCSMRSTMMVCTVLLFTSVHCAATGSDPLASATTSAMKLRAVMASLSGRVPGGAAVVGQLQVRPGLCLDVGAGITRPIGTSRLGTLGLPVIAYGEFGRLSLLRGGIGWLLTPMEADGMAILSVGFTSMDPREDIVFSVDVTWTPDRRFASRGGYYFTVIGLGVGVRL
jgi:hypothetical protein